MIYLLTAIRLTPSGSSTVHTYTQRIRRTTQLTTLFGRRSGIRNELWQVDKINVVLRISSSSSSSSNNNNALCVVVLSSFFAALVCQHTRMCRYLAHLPDVPKQ